MVSEWAANAFEDLSLLLDFWVIIPTKPPQIIVIRKHFAHYKLLTARFLQAFNGYLCDRVYHKWTSIDFAIWVIQYACPVDNLLGDRIAEPLCEQNFQTCSCQQTSNHTVVLPMPTLISIERATNIQVDYSNTWLTVCARIYTSVTLHCLPACVWVRGCEVAAGGMCSPAINLLKRKEFLAYEASVTILFYILWTSPQWCNATGFIPRIM